jgi:hypothetical protein
MQTHTTNVRTSVFFFLFFLLNTKAYSQVTGSSSNSFVSISKNVQIKFRWLSDSISQHSAMLIPVKLPQCQKQFYMQFDLGAPYSMFYISKMKSIATKFPAAFKKSLTSDTLTNFKFRLGKHPVVARRLALRENGNAEINWNNEVEIIGTIGADFIDGKVLILDYPNNLLRVTDTVSPKMINSSLQDFVYARNSILLPAEIQRKKTMLFFDSGSSAYELLASKETCESLAIAGTSFVKHHVNSWGKQLTTYTVTTNEKIKIGGAILPILHATYVEGSSKSQLERMSKLGIGGMMGNKLFLHHVLLIDTRNKKFGVLTSKDLSVAND